MSAELCAARDARARAPEEPHAGAGGGARGATGPRSAAGKERAAQNARKHGLTSARPDPAGTAAQIRALRAMPDISALPVDVLEQLVDAEILLAKVKAHQHSLIAREAPVDQAFCEAFRRVLRYRAEAEASYRKALRAVIAALEYQQSKEEPFHGT